MNLIDACSKSHVSEAWTRLENDNILTAEVYDDQRGVSLKVFSGTQPSAFRIGDYGFWDVQAVEAIHPADDWMPCYPKAYEGREATPLQEAWSMSKDHVAYAHFNDNLYIAVEPAHIDDGGRYDTYRITAYAGDPTTEGAEEITSAFREQTEAEVTAWWPKLSAPVWKPFN